jgi:hypothetical protein
VSVDGRSSRTLAPSLDIQGAAGQGTWTGRRTARGS